MNAYYVLAVVDSMPASNLGVLEWLAALSTPTIAIFAIWIAYQQLHLNRNQFRSDLMDKRLAILNSLLELLSVSIKDRHPDIKDLDIFELRTLEAKFLFGPEVISYLDEVKEKYMAIWNISEKDKDRDYENPKEKSIALEKRREYRSWMREQFLKSINIFKPYLDLTKAGIKPGSIKQEP